MSTPAPTPSKITLSISRKLALVLGLVGVLSTSAVAGLVYAPNSPGLPFVSPTYQVQAAPAHYTGLALNVAAYGVWYVPGTATLIVQVMAAFPHTHFFGVGSVGVLFGPSGPQANSPNGNFSVPVYIDNEKTFLVFPGNMCPDTSKITSTPYPVDVQLWSDSPPGVVSFEYDCQKTLSLTVLTVGNPHVIVPSIIPPTTPPPVTTGTEAMSLDSYSFTNSSTSVVLYLRNTGSVTISLASYYVKDSSGNQWALVSWSGPSINPNAVLATTFSIGTGCTSCTYSGTSGAFTQFMSGNSYTILVVTSRNNQFTFTVVK